MPELDTQKLWSEVLNAWDVVLMDGQASKALVSLRLGRIWGLLESIDDYALFGKFQEYAVKSLRRQKQGNKYLCSMFSEGIDQAEEQERWAKDALEQVARAVNRKAVLQAVGLLDDLPEFPISKN